MRKLIGALVVALLVLAFAVPADAGGVVVARHGNLDEFCKELAIPPPFFIHNWGYSHTTWHRDWPWWRGPWKTTYDPNDVYRYNSCGYVPTPEDASWTYRNGEPHAYYPRLPRE